MSIRHGGDIYDKEVICDFSVNINPKGIPEGVRRSLEASIGRIGCYPDIENRALKKSIAGYFEVDKDCIAVGNGVSELITAIFNALSPGRVIMPVPEFYGFIRAAEALHCHIDRIPTFLCPPENRTSRSARPHPEGEADADAGDVVGEGSVRLSSSELVEKLIERLELSGDEPPLTPGVKGSVRYGSSKGEGQETIVMLTNPNNPSGSLTALSDLTRLLDKCREKGCVLVVDESFIPFTSSGNANSIYREIQGGSLVIFRSFTKLFAMPGVRLGTMLSSAEIRKTVESRLPEWNISVFASEAGKAALKEKAYIASTAENIRTEREWLFERLTELGFKVYPSETDYLLLYTTIPLYERLLERKILIRDCADYDGLKEGFYRLAVRDHRDNLMLLDALEEITAGKKSSGHRLWTGCSEA